MNVPILESLGLLLAGFILIRLWRYLAGKGIQLGVFVVLGILLVLGMGVFLVGMSLWLAVVSFL